MTLSFDGIVIAIQECSVESQDSTGYDD